MCNESPTTPLIILGTGLLAEEFADLISEIPDYRVVAFIENLDLGKCDTTLLGLPILWIDQVAELDDRHMAICAIGTTRRDGFIDDVKNLGMGFATLAHPSARVSPSATIGEGTLISAGVIIAAQTRIGRHVILNRGCLIGHHTEVGDCVTISPGANIAGKVSIGDRAYIAMGATVLDRISIGANATVAAGSLVTRDVPPNTQVMGIPARTTKENVPNR